MKRGGAGPWSAGIAAGRAGIVAGFAGIDGRRVAGVLVACVFMSAVFISGVAAAHEGDAEDRAMRLHAQVMQLDRSWTAAVQETDAARRAGLLRAHAEVLRAVQETLRDAADRSPCVMLEANDPGRQLACLTDTEARLRATERVLVHVVNRLTLQGP